MSLARATADLLSRQATGGLRAGTVTAIDAVTGTLSLNLGDSIPVSGVNWLSSAYTPAVGDVVVATADESFGLFVWGKRSGKRTASEPDPVTVVVEPTKVWRSSNALTTGNDRLELGWSDWNDYYYTGIAQGPQGFSGDSSDPTYVTALQTFAHVWALIFPTIPTGATSVRLSIRVRDWSRWKPGAAPLVVHGHTYTSEPAPGAPVWLSGFEEWLTAPLLDGESGHFALPNTWQQALLNGTLKGLGFYTEKHEWSAGLGYGDLQVLLTYTPAPDAV